MNGLGINLKNESKSCKLWCTVQYIMVQYSTVKQLVSVLTKYAAALTDPFDLLVLIISKVCQTYYS